MGRLYFAQFYITLGQRTFYLHFHDWMFRCLLYNRTFGSIHSITLMHCYISINSGIRLFPHTNQAGTCVLRLFAHGPNIVRRTMNAFSRSRHSTASLIGQSPSRVSSIQCTSYLRCPALVSRARAPRADNTFRTQCNYSPIHYPLL